MAIPSIVVAGVEASRARRGEPTTRPPLSDPLHTLQLSECCPGQPRLSQLDSLELLHPPRAPTSSPDLPTSFDSHPHLPALPTRLTTPRRPPGMAQDALEDPFNPSTAPASKADLAPPGPLVKAHRPTLTTLLSTADLDAAHRDQDAPDLDLPLAPALSHDVLTGPNWDASAFLLERRHTPLDDLRSELRAYLATLRTSLVGVINEEYEAFIGLSLGLKHANVAQSLATIRRPVLSIRGEVTRVRGELDDMRTEMSRVLDERKEVRETKAMMRRLLSTEDAVDKVESLLRVGDGADKERNLDLCVLALSISSRTANCY